MVAASLLTASSPSPTAGHAPPEHRRPARASLPFPHHFPGAPTIHLGVPAPLHRPRQQPQWGSRRGDCLLVRAGAPSIATLVFAFGFPLSLIIGTIFAAARISDQLDEKFLQELAMNEAIVEENEEGGNRLKEDGVDVVPVASKDEQLVTAPMEVASATPRSRNRPKREA